MLGAVALVLIVVLTYYLTLTTRPEISEISPAPNSSQIPGMVELEARITSPRSIDEAIFLIDGDEIVPTLEQEDDSRWHVHHQQIFDRGERQIVLRVTDTSGRTAEHSWSFQASGDLIPPRLVLASPPHEVRLAPGSNGITIQATTFAEIAQIDLIIEGEEIEVEIEEIEAGTEYTNQDDLTIFDWFIRGTTRLDPGFVTVEANIVDEFGASTTGEWILRVVGNESAANARFFEQTGEYIMEPFLSYWEENDGLINIGPPVGPSFTDSEGVQLQYFRFARLELDEEGTVHRGLIGREVFGSPENPPDRRPGNNARQFDATGHYVIGTIREFWEENGALSAFGYPLSQEFETDNGYAQYFERALIEVIVLGSYEIVELAPLGERLYEEHVYQSGPRSNDEDAD
jgi:hypothetical protein